MTITTTAIGFSLLSLGLAFCGLRFFRAFKKIGGSRAGRKIGMLLSALFLTFALQLGILAIGALFFVGKPELFFLLVINHFLLAIIAALGIYVIFYIFLPFISPWPAVAAASALGVSVVMLTILTHPRPFIDASGGVDWNLSRWLDILLSYLLFLDIGALFVIFIHLFLQSKSLEVKIISLVQAVLAFMGVVNVFIRFLLPKGTMPEFLRTRVFDVTLAIIGLVYISVFLLPPVIIRWFSRSRS